MEMLINALKIATEAHTGQARKYNGRPYIEHPIRVAGEVATRLASSVSGVSKWLIIEEMIAAAYLHDVLEDTSVTAEDMVKHGIPVSVTALVKELTNPSKGMLHLSRSVRKGIDRDHLAKVSDQAKFIKLCDRLDNIRDIVVADPQFGKKYSQETLLLLDSISVGESFAQACEQLKAEIIKHLLLSASEIDKLRTSRAM